MSNISKQAEILAKLVMGEFEVDYPKPRQPISADEERYLDSGIVGATSTFLGTECLKPIVLLPHSKKDKSDIEIGYVATFDQNVVEAANMWFKQMVEERGLIVFCAELWCVTDRGRNVCGEAAGVRLWTEEFQLLYHNAIALKDGHRYLTQWKLGYDTREGGTVGPINIRDVVGPDEAN